MNKRIFYFIVFLLLISIVSAADHYVSPTGTASWSLCTSISNPCSLSTANSNAKAGDTVYLRGGTYYSQPIKPVNSGTGESIRIIFTNYGNEDVELNGNDKGVAIYLRTKDYITIDGLFINDWRKGFILYDGSDHNIIQNCRFLETGSYTGNEIAAKCVDENGYDCTGYGLGCNFNRILNNTFHDAPRDDYCKSDSYCSALPENECTTSVGCWWCSKGGSRTCWATGDQSCSTYCGTQASDLFEISSGYGNLVEDNWFGNAAHSDFIISHDRTDHTVVRGNRFENGYRRGGATTYFTEWQLWEDNEFFSICKEQQDNPMGLSKNQDVMYAGAGIQFAGTGNPDHVIVRKNFFQHTGNVISGVGRYMRLYQNTAHGMYMSFGHEGGDFQFNVVKNNIYSGLGTMDIPTIYPPQHIRIFVQAPQCTGFTTQTECEAFHGYCTWEENKCRGEFLNSNLFTHNTFYPEGTYWRYGWDGGASTIKSSLSEIEATFPSQFPPVANKVTDPKLSDPLNHDFHLLQGSPMIDAGDWLTKTRSSGSGIQIPVEDALYFYDGWDIPGEVGDLIQLEGETSTLRITEVDYDNDLITVDRSVTWTAGQGVSLPYIGSRPDIGAVEYGESPCTPSWSCSVWSSWSSCVNNQQTRTRTCTDVNSCSSDKTETETQSCNMPVSLVSHWRFDEGSGTYASDSAGGNDGTISGASWTTVSRSGGSALEFDGVDDFVMVNDDDSLDTGRITIILWIKIDDYGDYAGSSIGFIAKGDNSNRQYWAWLYKGNLSLEIDEGGYKNYIFSFEKDTWYQLAITFEGSEIATYVDGEEVKRITQVSGPILADDDPLYIGKLPGYSTVDGIIDEVMIFDGALNSSEIMEIYNENNCVHAADDNCDGCVDIGELIGYISEWKDGNVQISELMAAIGKWKNGC